MNVYSTLLFLLLSFGIYSQEKFDTISVYFNFNSATLRSVEKEKLKEINNEKLEIHSVIGHCDTTGSNQYNRNLSLRRINSVLDQINYSHNGSSIPKGESEARPSGLSDSQNRRVDVIYALNADTPEPEAPIVAQKSVLVQQFESYVRDSSKTKEIDLSLLFIPGSPILVESSRPELNELFQFMRYNTNIHIVIHGHVCCADDYKLSYDRAHMVYKYLQSGGISPRRMDYKGHSNKQPRRSPELTEEDRRLNRRVSITFTKQ
jgi:outer membrane protein OmpA-like peptidoglycan-associated protein